MEEDVRVLLAIEHIKRLKGLYCHAVATEDWEAFESLFARDLVFISKTVQTSSRDEFMALHRQNIQKSGTWGVVRCHTPIITITGHDTATGIWALDDSHFWPKIEGLKVGHRGYGHYYEEYVRLADGWRFKQIRVEYERMDALADGLLPPDFVPASSS